MNHKQAMRMAEEMLSKDEIDAIVYSCRRSDDDSTYSIVREAIAAALVKYTQWQEAVEFLANATRYKVAMIHGGQGSIMGLPEELCGRWVALVAADDDCHMKLTHPASIQPEHDSEWEQRWPNAETPAPSQQEELLALQVRNQELAEQVGQQEEQIRELERKLIECRSSVKYDCNNWERLVMRKESDGSCNQVDRDELTRVGKLLDYIDAIEAAHNIKEQQ